MIFSVMLCWITKKEFMEYIVLDHVKSVTAMLKPLWLFQFATVIFLLMAIKSALKAKFSADSIVDHP